MAADGRRFVFLLNHRHSAVSVPLGRLAGADLLTGRRLARSVSLPPLGGAVLVVS